MPHIEKINLPTLLKTVVDKNETVAIAIEGGGLRGVVSAAMLSVFEEYEIMANIKGISGTSSGAINGAYFLNKNTQSVLQLYSKMSSPKFIQPHRWPNAMNLNYLFDEQIKDHHPIDWPSIYKSPIPFYISTTNVTNGVGEFHRAQDCQDENQIFTLIKASASAPLYCTNKESLNGQAYNDGHVALALPIDCYDVSKFDKIFCLMTQKRGYEKKFNIPQKLLNLLALKNYSAAYKKSFKSSDRVYNRQMKTIMSIPTFVPLMIEEEDYIVSKKCTDPHEVERCIDSVRSRFLKQT